MATHVKCYCVLPIGGVKCRVKNLSISQNTFVDFNKLTYIHKVLYKNANIGINCQKYGVKEKTMMYRNRK